MKILVCVKQVPESETSINIDDASGWIKMDHFAKFKMNRLDKYSVEEAILIKEVFPNVTVDIISVGPERSAEVIKRAIGMGADHGIHILTSGDAYISSFAVSSRITAYARNKNYELILAGAMSEDYMQGQIGPMVSAQLALPLATAVIFEHLSPDLKTVYVEREIEGGNRDTLELRLPAVLTIQSGINKPRYPSLSNLLRANKQELEIIGFDSMVKTIPKEYFVGMTYPVKSRAGEILEGTQQEKANQLLNIFREKAFIS